MIHLNKTKYLFTYTGSICFCRFRKSFCD